MADYSFSREARFDLLEIWDYISRDNISAADRVMEEIEETVAMLARNPDLGTFAKI
jgi:plasmid stabilization system protein ParE